MTTINFESPAIGYLAEASANEGSVFKGLEHVAGKGILGALARELAELAEEVAKSGYVPPAKRAEHARHERLAKSTQDREVAQYHREKAREIRAQNGGTCVYCDAVVTKEAYKADHFGGACVGGPNGAGKAEAERIIKDIKQGSK